MNNENLERCIESIQTTGDSDTVSNQPPAAVYPSPESPTTREARSIESSGRRRFLQNSIVAAGGALTVGELAHASASIDPGVVDDDAASDVFSAAARRAVYGADSSGDRFKALLMPKLDAALWPPEALRPDYIDAAPPQVVVPSDGRAYEDARQTFNIRYQRYPAAIFYALNTEQVQAAVVCAAQLNLRVSAAGGRNSFLSMATPDGYIVIDLSNMKSLSLDMDAMVARAEAGVTGPMINSATAKHEGLTIASGVCGFVGAIPWTLGGGFGFLGHRLGAGCDNLVNVEMVLADGTVVNANAQENPDLFWASQGGGGGTFGIVTSVEIRLHMLPNKGHIYGFELVYTGRDAFVQGFDAFQKWFPTASRLWAIDEPRLAPVLSGTPNPFFSFLCYYLGPEEDAIADLEAAGLLFDVGGSVKFVKMGWFPDHQTWYGVTNSTLWMGGAGIPTTPKAIINGLSMNAFGQPFMVQAMQTESVNRALYGGQGPVNDIPSSPFLGTQVVGGKYYHVNQFVVNRMLDLVPLKTLQKAADFLYRLSEESVAGNVVSGLIYAGGHMLGGAYADKAPTETAFFWREKIMVLYFTFALPAGYREQLDEREYERGKRLTNQFMRIFCPANTPKQAAYVNYQQEKFPNWQYGYFGDNYKRLQAIKSKYDPEGRFDKKFTVKGK